MTVTESLTAVLVVLTTILVVITGVYAWLTARISRANEAVVAAMRAEREAAMRPYVTISTFAPPRSPELYLQVANTGRTAAVDVRLILDRPFHSHSDPDPRYNLQTFSAFAEVIDSLSPGQSLFFALTIAPDLFGAEPKPSSLVPPLFKIRATYRWATDVADESTTVDLRPYARTNLVPDPLLAEIEKIRRALESKK